MHRFLVFCLMLFAAGPVLATGPERPDAQPELWQKLRAGGHVIFIRHALTDPGIGDPPHFRLGDCRTQRNLSEQGRADARRIGAAFRHNQVPVSGVWSSRWCRCLETAQLAFAEVIPAAMLDSTFRETLAGKQEKAQAVFSFVHGADIGGGNFVFITHAQNIQELTGVSPSSGEAVVTKSENASRFRVVGRLPVPLPMQQHDSGFKHEN